MVEIYIKDFTTSPGGRYEKEGNFSGEEFRTKFLEPHFSSGLEEKIDIYLDGTEGYPSSFLEEAFGGLVRKIGNKEAVKNKLNFITNDSILKIEIQNYIEKAL
jgi:hypothetical protein